MASPIGLQIAEQLFRCGQVLRFVLSRMEVIDAPDRAQLLALVLRIDQAVAKYGPVEVSADLRRTEP